MSTSLHADTSTTQWPAIPGRPPGVDPVQFPADPMFGAGLDDIDKMRLENDHLRRILVTQPYIEQAKGVLMYRYDLDSDTAFQLLSRWSQAMEVRVSRVATALLEITADTDIAAAPDDTTARLRTVLGPSWKR